MLSAWVPNGKGLVKHEACGLGAPLDSLWIDIVDITKEEETFVERLIGHEIPTRAEMQEIEASSRLYREGMASFMTATLLIKTETENPESTAVTFILTKERLVTLRYAEPWSFRTFAQRAGKSEVTTAEQAFVTLMDTTIERLADMLELVALELDHVSAQVFRKMDQIHDSRLQRTLLKIGTCGHILTKVRESLIDKNRIITFAQQSTQEWMSAEERSRLKALLHDVQTLTDHATFLNGKINFLLDATLGLINIEQNRIIKIFSIAAVIFLPPTLVASIYGMNFKHMPELEWYLGYPMAMAIMICSVVTTIWVFRRRRWL
jgi:magnesium transporter